MFKSVEEFQKFGADQMEAATQSASALSQGVQQLVTETSALSKKSVETGTDAFQNLLASRSLDRAVQVQMDYAKTAYDSLVAGSSRIGAIMAATAQDMYKPLEGAFSKVQGSTRT